MKKKIIIIGGGYAGLAAAVLFAETGHTVTVLEKNSQLGGRAGQLRSSGFRFDTGPSWYLMPEVFEHYYSLLGLYVQKELSLTRLQPGYKVFFESHAPITIYGDLSKDAATFESIERGAGDRLKEYVKKSQRVYDLSVRSILYNNYDSLGWAFQRQLLKELPAFVKLATTTLDAYVSQQFNDIRLKQILEYHSVFLGTSPYKAPAIYSLMSTLDFKSGVFYPKNGIYSLVESLHQLGKTRGVTYKISSPVDAIVTSGNVARGVRLISGELLEADVVISAADLHHTETMLLPKDSQSYPEPYWKKKEPSPSALLISLGIKGKLAHLQHHNLYFVDAWKENFAAIYDTFTIPENASIYICNPSATDPTTAPAGNENIFILLPLPAHKKLTLEETTSLTKRCIEQLSIITESSDLASRIITEDILGPEDFATRFNAWEYNSLAGQSHVLLQSAFFRTPNKSKKLENLYYVGAGTNPGVGLPMCLISAELVYKRVCGIHSSGPLASLVKGESE